MCGWVRGEERGMVHGAWCMGHGAWRHGAWGMGHGAHPKVDVRPRHIGAGVVSARGGELDAEGVPGQGQG